MANDRKDTNLVPGLAGVAGLGAAGSGYSQYLGHGFKPVKNNASKLSEDLARKWQSMGQKGREAYFEKIPKKVNPRGTGITGLKERLRNTFQKGKQSVTGLTGEEAARIESRLYKKRLQRAEEKFLAEQKGKIGYKVRAGANKQLRRLVSSLRRNPKAWMIGGGAALLGGNLLRD